MGSTPTYSHVGLDRDEVLDQTFCTGFMSYRVRKWHVSDEPSLSDHRHIRFDLQGNDLVKEQTRIPSDTDWLNFTDRGRCGSAWRSYQGH